jgi:hypothetical protein
MSDKIKINNAPHDEIYNAITNIVISQKKINQAYFISHANTEINKLCIDLLSNQHFISDNWALKHKIYTGRENQNLRKTAEKAVLSLKLQHVEDKIQIIQKKIQQNTSAVQELNILKNLIMIKNQISLKIGRSSS